MELRELEPAMTKSRHTSAAYVSGVGGVEVDSAGASGLSGMGCDRQALRVARRLLFPWQWGLGVMFFLFYPGQTCVQA